MTTLITLRDEAQIACYFRDGYKFERSTAGPMLERAQNLGVTSDGERLVASADNWHWREPMRDEESGVYSRYGDDAQLQLHETRLNGGYEPDEMLFMRWGTIGRRMLAVERVSPRAKVALEAYYGDRGALWAYYSQSGTGPGAIASLFMLTNEGAALIAHERKSRKRSEVHLTDDELLANAFAIQRVQPCGKRRARITAAQDAAETALRGAWSVWQQTAPERRRRAA